MYLPGTIVVMVSTVRILTTGARRYRIWPGHHVDGECFIKEAEFFR